MTFEEFKLKSCISAGISTLNACAHRPDLRDKLFPSKKVYSQFADAMHELEKIYGVEIDG